MMMRQGAPSASLWDAAKLGRALGALEGSAITQRGLDRLEKWADRDLRKFSKHRVLHLKWNKACTSTGWGLTGQGELC